MSFKNIKVVLGIVCLILLIPLFGNFFVEGWNWSPLDFVFAFFMLFVTGLAIDFAIRKIGDLSSKILAVIFIILLFLAVWTELAVGAVSRVIDLILQ